MQQDVIRFEKSAIAYSELERYIEHMPRKMVEVLLINRHHQVPTLFGIHRETGWFVLETTGQGPYFAYRQIN